MGNSAGRSTYRALGESETALRHAERALVHASEPRQPLALLAAHRRVGALDTDEGRYEDAARTLLDQVRYLRAAGSAARPRPRRSPRRNAPIEIMLVAEHDGDDVMSA